MTLGIRATPAGHHPDKKIGKQTFADSLQGENRSFHELHKLSMRKGETVTYDPEYPASPSPIIQFRILDDVPYLGQPRFVKPGEIV